VAEAPVELHCATMTVHAEFTVEPFNPGEPGPHVTAAFSAAEACGASLEVGPFGTLLRGATDEVVFAAVDAAVRAAVNAGATRVSFQLSAD
jgi:uncharacterized protein YqgV (UPF0045/DUF77 family)